MSTLKDVAKLAGVSTSTVSRTLSNRVFVEEETKKKVLKAVEELNYRPNIAAKGLKSGKTFMMGFMVPDINSVFYPMIMKSIERYAAEVGYSLILMNKEENIKKEKQALQSFMGRGVDGILCMSVEDDISHLEEFQKNQKIPVVLVNRTASKDMSSVSIDNEHGIRDYKKYFIYDVDSIEEAYLRTVEILKSEDRPTAFFASMDILAIGIYSAVSAVNLKIPEDISIVGFDNIFMTQYMIPPLTTYNPFVDAIAKNSVELLVQQIELPECEKKQIILEGALEERKSVRRLV